jgi:phage tail sheath gpL-like
MAAILEPKVNFEILPAEQIAGVQEQKVLIIGQMLTGTATPGELVTDIANNNAENALFGMKSHIASLVRDFKVENKISRLDAIPLEDAIGGSPSSCEVKFNDSPTEDGSLTVILGSAKKYSYTINVLEDQTIVSMAQSLIDSINADTYAPFTAATTSTLGQVKISLSNTGLIGSDWVTQLYHNVAGLFVSSGGFQADGGLNPSLTDIFNTAGLIRYQTIVWPSLYPTDEVETFLNNRFNYDNVILDGVGLQTKTGTLTDLETYADQNSQSIAIIGNKALAAPTTGKLICDSPAGSVPTFTAVTDGSFKLTVDGGQEQDITDIDLGDTAGYMDCGTPGSLDDFLDVSDASFKITIDGGTEQSITAVDIHATAAYMDCGALTGTLEDFQDIAGSSSFQIAIDDLGNQNIVVSTSATSGELHSQLIALPLVNPATVLANFQVVADGSFAVTIDGTPYDVTGIDFTTPTVVANLTEVASRITPSLTDAVCSFDADRFVITSSAKGTISTVSFLTPVSPATGTDISGSGYMHSRSGEGFQTPGTGPSNFPAIASILSAAVSGAVCTYETDHFRFTSESKLLTSYVSVLDNGTTGTNIAGSAYLNGLAGTATIHARTGPGSFDNIATVLSSPITGGYCNYETDHFRFISSSTGSASTVSVLTNGVSGTNIAGSSYLNGLPGTGVENPGTGPTNYFEIALVISSFLDGVICTYETDHFVFTSELKGVKSRVSVLSAGSSGTDLSGSSYLNGLTGELINGTGINSRLGAAIAETPDMISSQIAAIRSLRLTAGADLKNYLTTSAIQDQSGGIAISSLPYFNTLIPNIAVPFEQDTWSLSEQDSLKEHGISIIGSNRLLSSVIMGEFVTTYLTNDIGSPDPSYKYLNTIDTVSHIREFLYENCRQRYSQTRLTDTDLIPGRDMANAGSIRVFLNELYISLSEYTLVQAGTDGLKDFNQNLIISVDLPTGTATVSCAPLLVSQLRAIIGSIKINFGG